MVFDLMNQAVRIDTSGDAVRIESPPGSDFFIDGGSGAEKTNAPFYYTEIEGDFILRCLVQPRFEGTYDAGCLCAYESAVKWIKLAFERTDLGYESVVTVVTDGLSDDCNGERIGETAVWLQMVRKGSQWCLHHSNDGIAWKMSRYFSMAMAGTIKIGVMAQSPTGGGCTVDFRHLAVTRDVYGDIRSAR